METNAEELKFVDIQPIPQTIKEKKNPTLSVNIRQVTTPSAHQSTACP